MVPDAQQLKEPDDQESGSYCFEELEPAKVLEIISTEIIELTDSSEDPECSRKSRKPLEKGGIIGNYETDERKAQATSSES